jgi:hypothetical protein
VNAEKALAEHSDLEKQLERFQAGENNWQRYILTDFGGGTFAYAPKIEQTRKQNSHRLCAKCFQEEHQSILQFQGRTIFGQEIYACTRCKTAFHLGRPRNPNPPSRAHIG